MTGIRRPERYGHSERVAVRTDGSFTATYRSVSNGEYRAQVLMPILDVQPIATRRALGRNGENIRGPWRHVNSEIEAVLVRREADLTISDGNILVNYLGPNSTNADPDPVIPTAEQWLEWKSDNDLGEKKKIYSQIADAWAAADEEARQKGLLARRERLSKAPVDLNELDKVEQQIENIEKRKFEELAKELGISLNHLSAINAKGSTEGW